MSHKNSGIIGEDTSLAEVFKILRKVAPTDSTVLLPENPERVKKF